MSRGPAPAAPPVGSAFAAVSLRPGSGADRAGSAPAGPVQGSGVPQGARTTSTSTDAPAAPRWGAVEAGSPAGWSPVPGEPGSARSGAGSPGPTGTEEDGARGEEPDETSTRAHPYSFLHMLVLVLVAFVLGMLIFMVVVNEPPAADAAEPAVQSMTHTPTHEAGD